MLKRCLVLLSAIMLTVFSSSSAEYKSYLLTEGNWQTCFPLDAHNTVVSSRDWHEDSEPDPWYVCWYRDGVLYRELTGSIPEGDRTARLQVPRPALWDGERLSLYYCVRTKPLKTYQQGFWIPTPDPDCFEVHLAEWTEEGLENDRILPEAWFDTYDNDGCDARSALVYSGDRGRTALYNGQETLLPDSVPVNLAENILRVLPVAGDVCLVKVMDNGNGCAQVVCLDHGAERYRVTLPENEMNPGRILLPEKRGGFFCIDGYRPARYEPEILTHYGEDGRIDRTLALAGRNVVVHLLASAVSPGSGLCTLYGTAVANSRKVYTVFAMALDEDLNVTRLDVRKIDPAYGDYSPVVMVAADGTPYVYIESYSGEYLYPVLIPFSKLKKSRQTYGLALR